MDEDDVAIEKVIHQPPSCIEFCPAHPLCFVIGTYKLDESRSGSHSTEGTSSQSRSGRVELYQIKRNHLSSSFGISQCIDLYHFPACAVLDLHFHPHDPTFFAVCTSTSHIVFFSFRNFESELKGNGTRPSILKVGAIHLSEDDAVLATSFAWDKQQIPQYMSIAVTFSSGEIKVFRVRQDIRSETDHQYQIAFQTTMDPAHSLEAWTAAFAGFPSTKENERILLTGGDDSVLAAYSLQNDLHSGLFLGAQLFQDRKSHSAGVTAILPILDGSQDTPSMRAFVTGSYDEHIRVFTVDGHPPYKRKLVADFPLGGGVWRLKKMSLSPTKEVEGNYISSVLILASCMHAGVRIVRITRRQSNPETENGTSWKAEIVGQFTKGHESMCYGADSINTQRLTEPHAQFPNAHFEGFVVVSTSFYDRKICAWSFPQ
jgi:diphthine methyl ester acylhydrolase